MPINGPYNIPGKPNSRNPVNIDKEIIYGCILKPFLYSNASYAGNTYNVNMSKWNNKKSLTTG